MQRAKPLPVMNPYHFFPNFGKLFPQYVLQDACPHLPAGSCRIPVNRIWGAVCRPMQGHLLWSWSLQPAEEGNIIIMESGSLIFLFQTAHLSLDQNQPFSWKRSFISSGWTINPAWPVTTKPCSSSLQLHIFNPSSLTKEVKLCSGLTQMTSADSQKWSAYKQLIQAHTKAFPRNCY